jgi:hypothetical protein
MGSCNQGSDLIPLVDGETRTYLHNSVYFTNHPTFAPDRKSFPTPSSTRSAEQKLSMNLVNFQTEKCSYIKPNEYICHISK